LGDDQVTAVFLVYHALCEVDLTPTSVNFTLNIYKDMTLAVICLIQIETL